MPTRSTTLAVTVNGFAVTRLLSARTTSSWKTQFPDALFTVPRVPQNVSAWQATHAYSVGAYVKPVTRNSHVYRAIVAGTSAGSHPTWPTTNDATVTDGGVTWQESGLDVTYNDAVEITMNGTLRFRGLVRKLNYNLWPRGVGVQCFGYLTLVHEYQNTDGNVQFGGLSLEDLTGSFTAVDEDIVTAVLDRTGIDTALYTGNILGTGVTWGSRSDTARYQYVWRAAMMPGANVTVTGIGGVGQSALDYIQAWDKVSAVYTDAVSPAGFYRLYETVNGIFRDLIGGRPRNTIDLTFTEGVDIEANGQGTREYPLANAAYVTGGDFGVSGANPVRNVDFSTVPPTFVGFVGNSFQPTDPVTYEFSSAFIEFGIETDVTGTIGMCCERVGNALLQDLNRETVTARFRTPLDGLITPGMTILVQGPGGQPDRMGIGENLWVDEVTSGVDESGMFYQDIAATGGGLPDAYTPAPDG